MVSSSKTIFSRCKGSFTSRVRCVTGLFLFLSALLHEFQPAVLEGIFQAAADVENCKCNNKIELAQSDLVCVPSVTAKLSGSRHVHGLILLSEFSGLHLFERVACFSFMGYVLYLTHYVLSSMASLAASALVPVLDQKSRSCFSEYTDDRAFCGVNKLDVDSPLNRY